MEGLLARGLVDKSLPIVQLDGKRLVGQKRVKRLAPKRFRGVQSKVSVNNS
jgi:hypothetical protein